MGDLSNRPLGRPGFLERSRERIWSLRAVWGHRGPPSQGPVSDPDSPGREEQVGHRFSERGVCGESNQEGNLWGKGVFLKKDFPECLYVRSSCLPWGACNKKPHCFSGFGNPVLRLVLEASPDLRLSCSVWISEPAQ